MTEAHAALRLPDGTDWHSEMPNGSYWKGADGTWFCLTPNGLFGSLRKHTVTEHDDGTISVTPSILVTAGEHGSWHGYLTKGLWNVC